MAGWTSPDRENIYWDGTLIANKLKASDAIFYNLIVNTIAISDTAGFSPKSNIDIDYSNLTTGAGTVSCNGTSGVVTGTSTSFLSVLNTGDLIQFVGVNRWVQVMEITSNTSMVVYPAVSATNNAWKYVKQGIHIRNQGLTVSGSSITDTDDEETHITLDAQAPLGDNTYGFLSIVGSSNAGNLRMASFIDRGTSGGPGSPYIYIENQNGSGSRVGANIIGLRSDGSAFLQTQNQFRMEAFGGGLGMIISGGLNDNFNGSNTVTIGDHQGNLNNNWVQVDDNNQDFNMNIANNININGTPGFTGTGAYVNFTFDKGICTAAA